MSTLWSFLLQTLTAAGVAALVLAVKALFQDKLSPRWQFAAWLPLLLVLFLPAGRGGRYVLLNWPWYVETVKTLLTGDYDLTAVTAPIPLSPLTMPQRWDEWLFLIYCLGVLALLARYALAYLRLRLALHRGTPAGETLQAQLARVADQYGLPTCPAVVVPGLPSAFLCGLIRPVLALPAEAKVDDKVLLHELLHLKHRDTLWSVLVCALRCLHWCNPLLWYCADRAGNDLEALCDQRVLELLEGEDRRDYGRILLSMANETYPRSPGTSSLANGGENIRRRIESIARFKRYPAGMGLVSACVLVTLCVPLAAGTEITLWQGAGQPSGPLSFPAAMASARLNPCTTYAGAFDTYAKAVLHQNAAYRAMCLSEEEMPAFTATQSSTPEDHGLWDPGLPSPIDSHVWGGEGYYVYNLQHPSPHVYEGLLAIRYVEPPEGVTWNGHLSERFIALQHLRVEQRGDYWVAIPLEDFSVRQGSERVGGVNVTLPGWTYTGQTDNYRFTYCYRTWHYVNTQGGESDFTFSFPTNTKAPIPNALFQARKSSELSASYLGNLSADPADDRNLTVVYRPYWGEKPESELPVYYVNDHLTMTYTWSRDMADLWQEDEENAELLDNYLILGCASYPMDSEDLMPPDGCQLTLHFSDSTNKYLDLKWNGGEHDGTN